MGSELTENILILILPCAVQIYLKALNEGYKSMSYCFCFCVTDYQ